MFKEYFNESIEFDSYTEILDDIIRESELIESEDLSENVLCDDAKASISFQKEQAKKFKKEAKQCKKAKTKESKSKCLTAFGDKVQKAKEAFGKAKIKAKENCLGSKISGLLGKAAKGLGKGVLKGAVGAVKNMKL